jgi:hypothetical protein
MCERLWTLRFFLNSGTVAKALKVVTPAASMRKPSGLPSGMMKGVSHLSPGGKGLGESGAGDSSGALSTDNRKHASARLLRDVCDSHQNCIVFHRL